MYFPNVSQPVLGGRTNNGAEVSAVRAAMQRVLESHELCPYSDSKWCVDIFSNLHVYKHKGWMAQGKKPVRHHDVREEIGGAFSAVCARASIWPFGRSRNPYLRYFGHHCCLVVGFDVLGIRHFFIFTLFHPFLPFCTHLLLIFTTSTLFLRRFLLTMGTPRRQG